MAGRYTELYRRARAGIEADAEKLLNRPLTPHERNLFRSCGTLTMLESLGMLVYYAHTAEELEAKLAEISMGSRFTLALNESLARLEHLLGRPVNEAEHNQLRALGNTEELWTLEEALQQASTPHEKEIVLQTFLSPPDEPPPA
jgi:hypothetical protein